MKRTLLAIAATAAAGHPKPPGRAGGKKKEKGRTKDEKT
jgi:hypothetical protein